MLESLDHTNTTSLRKPIAIPGTIQGGLQGPIGLQIWLVLELQQ